MPLSWPPTTRHAMASPSRAFDAENDVKHREVFSENSPFQGLLTKHFPSHFISQKRSKAHLLGLRALNRLAHTSTWWLSPARAKAERSAESKASSTRSVKRSQTSKVVWSHLSEASASCGKDRSGLRVEAIQVRSTAPSCPSGSKSPVRHKHGPVQER